MTIGDRALEARDWWTPANPRNFYRRSNASPFVYGLALPAPLSLVIWRSKFHFGAMEDRRDVLAKLGLLGLGFASPAQSEELPTGARTNVRKRSVMEFGACGDGLTDDTEAFNAATEANKPWKEGLSDAITVPAGRYRVNGTIHLRKGQHLVGEGEATVIDASGAHGTTLTMGTDARGRPDPGGAPVGVNGLRFLGGTGTAPVVSVKAEGFSLSRLFFSAAGTAIEISGADGILSEITIDQALRGLVFSSAQNIIVQGLISYLANFAVTLGNASSDILISQAVMAYSRYASVLFAEGVRGIQSVRFSNCDFVSNESYREFLGHVHIRSDACDAQFSACTFRNHPGFAVREVAGSSATLTFDNCIFDGSPSREVYNKSVSAGGLLTGASSRFHLSGCHFRNLENPVIRVGPYLKRLVLSGGSIQNCTGDPLQFDPRAGGQTIVRGVDGFGRRNQDGSFVLPWRGIATGWRVTARATDGSGAIAVCECTVLRQKAEQIIAVYPSPASALPLVAAFGDSPGGPQRAPAQDQGLLCLSAERSDLEWTAETLA